MRFIRVDEVDIHPLEKRYNFYFFRVDEYQPSSTLINLYKPSSTFINIL